MSPQWIVIGVLIALVYFIFIKKKPLASESTKKKADKLNDDDMIECKKCTKVDIYYMIKTFWKNKVDITLKDINDEIDGKFTSAEIMNHFRNTNNFNDVKHVFVK